MLSNVYINKIHAGIYPGNFDVRSTTEKTQSYN